MPYNGLRGLVTTCQQWYCGLVMRLYTSAEARKLARRRRKPISGRPKILRIRRKKRNIICQCHTCSCYFKTKGNSRKIRSNFRKKIELTPNACRDPKTKDKSKVNQNNQSKSLQLAKEYDNSKKKFTPLFGGVRRQSDENKTNLKDKQNTGTQVSPKQCCKLIETDQANFNRMEPSNPKPGCRTIGTSSTNLTRSQDKINCNIDISYHRINTPKSKDRVDDKSRPVSKIHSSSQNSLTRTNTIRNSSGTSSFYGSESSSRNTSPSKRNYSDQSNASSKRNSPKVIFKKKRSNDNTKKTSKNTLTGAQSLASSNNSLNRNYSANATRRNSSVNRSRIDSPKRQPKKRGKNTQFENTNKSLKPRSLERKTKSPDSKNMKVSSTVNVSACARTACSCGKNKNGTCANSSCNCKTNAAKKEIINNKDKNRLDFSTANNEVAFRNKLESPRLKQKKDPKTEVKSQMVSYCSTFHSAKMICGVKIFNPRKCNVPPNCRSRIPIIRSPGCLVSRRPQIDSVVCRDISIQTCSPHLQSAATGTDTDYRICRALNMCARDNEMGSFTIDAYSTRRLH